MLDKFFRKQPQKTEAPKVAKAPEVPYDPGLVTALTHQHRSLVMLLVKASSAAQQDLYEDVQETLAQFKLGLDEHLKRENTELHPYLAAHLRGDDAKDVLREMRTNAALIERTVEGFLNHYIGYPVSATNVQRFEMEIEGVSEEFSQEVEREEASFYTLYMPPEAY